MSATVTYTCELCHQTFDSDWPDEEAAKECEALFGQVPMSDCAIVCDDCFQMIDPRKPENAEVVAAWRQERPQ
jgi:hypothetical protein